MGNEASGQSQDFQQQQQGPDGGAGPAVPGYQSMSGAPPAVAGLNSGKPPAAGPPAARPPAAPAGDASLGQGGEGLLLSQLVQLLHNRPRGSLLLSDLGALLPQQLRSSVKEKGGLRSWLQKHPMLFSVSGQPGKESVTLTLGGVAPPGNAGNGGAQQDFALAATSASSDFNAGQNSQKKANEDDDDESASCVQMRGLPYRATTNDVKFFLAKHAANLKDDAAVQLVLNRDGRPSGFARVQFVTPAAARAARDELHNGVMKTASDAAGNTQERYVEIFLYSERPNKLRFRKGLASMDGQPENIEQEEPDNATKEQVIQECREHMASPGKAQLLLSMLGVALSPTSRAHLKKTDLGLKHFLSQYPLEFRVEGVKGRECITYLPAMPKNFTDAVYQKPPTPAFQDEAPRKVLDEVPRKGRGKGTAGPASGSLNDLAHFPIEECSPGLRSPGMPISPGFGARGLATPSDWGTPQPGLYDWERPKAPAAAAPPQDAAPTQPAASPMDFMNAFDPTANWAAWGMPPGMAPMGPMGPMGPGPWGAPGMPVGLAPWGGMPVGSASSPPWMMDPSYGLPRPAPMTQSNLGHPSTMPASTSASAPGEQSCVLRLRGLPFTCSEQEIYAFFSKHEVVENIADINKAVTFLTKTNGKPSGQATVQMQSRADAERAQHALHGQWIGSRYIEVFPYVDDGSNDVSEKVAAEFARSDIGGAPGFSTGDPETEIPSAGDTGGSGGTPPGIMMPPNAVPWNQGPWGAGRDGEVSALMAQRSAVRQAGAMGADMQAPNPFLDGMAGSGEVGMNPMAGPGGGQSWEALFDFLKRPEQGGAPVEGNPAHVHVNPI